MEWIHYTSVMCSVFNRTKAFTGQPTMAKVLWKRIKINLVIRTSMLLRVKHAQHLVVLIFLKDLG